MPNAKMTKELIILPSQCDDSGRLGIAQTFELFMDLATQHADQLGFGLRQLSPKNLFWLTVKTKVHFYHRPAMLESVQAATWPEQPGKVRANRHYGLYQGDTLLAGGLTEWAVINLKEGTLARMEDIYPQDLCVCEETTLPEGFHRITEDFSEEPFGVYKVKSTDIDLGRHMNNTAYVKAMLSFFSTKELSSMQITDVEVNFRSQSFEQECLEVFMRESTEEDTHIREIRLSHAEGKEAGKAAVLCRIASRMSE